MVEWLIGRGTTHHGVRTLRHRTDKPILRAHLSELARRLYGDQRGGTRRGIVAADMFLARRHEKR